MSLLDMFRKKGPAPATPGPAAVPVTPLPDAVPASAAPAAPALQSASASDALQSALPDASQEPNIRATDEFGREILIPVSEWRKEVLPNALDQVQNNPDALAPIILDALQVGASTEVLPFAAKLQSIDQNLERGAMVHGLALLTAGQAAEAEDVFVTYLGQQGPSAPILAHLARAQAVQNRLDEADATLWRALEADPNNDTAVGLYTARSREREGDFGWQAALERAATLPGAWLPLLWLGRSALEARNRTLALGLYKQALERGGRPSPPVLLQGVSGDLGQFGLLEDSVRLARPLFEPEIHGLAVGNNLIKASLDLGQLGDALGVVRELRALNRPDFAEPLRAWEIEIRRRDLAAQTSANPPAPQLLRIDGPVWLPPASPARSLYPTGTPRRAAVLFLGSSASLPPEIPAEIAQQLPDVTSRLSRALPLFLSEGAYILLGLDTATFYPWADTAGFAMLGQSWPDETAAIYARDMGAGAAVSAHIDGTPDGAEVTLRLVPAAEAQPSQRNNVTPIDFGTAPSELEIGSPADSPDVASDEAASELAANPLPPHREPVTITLKFSWPEMQNNVLGLWAQLAHHLVTYFGDNPEPPVAGRYTPPRGLDLGLYLRYLEALLGIMCAGTTPNGVLLLQNERDTLRGLIDLAVRFPQSLPVRLMLGETIVRLRDLHPEVLAEFANAIGLLVQRHPFTDFQAAEVLDAQLKQVYTFTPVNQA